MSLRSIWDKLRGDLVDRRLLPIPVVLVAGLIAIPVLASKDRSTARALPFATPVTTPTTTTTTEKPKSTPRRVKGDSNSEVNPFATAAATSSSGDSSSTTSSSSGPSQQTVASTTDTAKSAPSGAGTSNGSGTDSATSSHSVVTPNSTVIAASGNKFAIRAVDVRMGGDIVPRIRRDVARLSPLPSNDAPAALFLGVLPGAKSAAFRLSPGVTVAGEGTCVPRRSMCVQLVLHKGDRALLTRPSGRRLRLELVRVRVTHTPDEARARKAYDRYSPAGQCILDTVSAYSFDRSSGLLHRSGVVESCHYADADPETDTSGSLRGASVKHTSAKAKARARARAARVKNKTRRAD